MSMLAVRNVNKEPEEPAQVADEEESPVAEAWQGFVDAECWLKLGRLRLVQEIFGQIRHLHFERKLFTALQLEFSLRLAWFSNLWRGPGRYQCQVGALLLPPWSPAMRWEEITLDRMRWRWGIVSADMFWHPLIHFRSSFCVILGFKLSRFLLDQEFVWVLSWYGHAHVATGNIGIIGSSRDRRGEDEPPDKCHMASLLHCHFKVFSQGLTLRCGPY